MAGTCKVKLAIKKVEKPKRLEQRTESVDDIKKRLFDRFTSLRAKNSGAVASQRKAIVQGLMIAGVSAAKASQIRVRGYGAVVVKPISGHGIPLKEEKPRNEKAFNLLDKEEHKKFFDIIMRTRNLPG